MNLRHKRAADRGRHTGNHAIELHGVRRHYGRGSTTVHALRGIDLALPHRSFTAVMGPSGSGKSVHSRATCRLPGPLAIWGDRDGVPDWPA